MTIEQRLERLERSARRWRIAFVFAMLIASVGIYTGAAAPVGLPKWEFAHVQFGSDSGFFQSDREQDVWNNIGDRQRFVKQLTGKDTQGTQMAVLGAVSAQGWEIAAFQDVGDPGANYLLRRPAP